MHQRFADRHQAGRILASMFPPGDGEAATVLGLPRGGVPVAAVIAEVLDAPLDVFVVRKIGVPWQPELALGAIASGGIVQIDRQLAQRLRVSDQEIEEVVGREREELIRRERRYRSDHAQEPLADRHVIVVDDGVATGSSMRVALTALRQHRPRRLTVAVPVAPPSTCEALGELADAVICVMSPDPFGSVGAFYGDFTQTTDAEVEGLLRAARERRAATAAARQGDQR